MKTDRLLLWIFVALLVGGGGYMAVRLTRGIRNNNPGNIVKGIAWKGIDSAKTALESRFIVFTAPEWGIRAMARLLKNYYNLYGLKTVRAIIDRWAPPSENDTGSYVTAVANRLNVGPDEPINIVSVMPDLIGAIIRHENGAQPYPSETIQRGIELERTA